MFLTKFVLRWCVSASMFYCKFVPIKPTKKTIPASLQKINANKISKGDVTKKSKF